jgi:UDP-N-acetylmuramate dehydrogenase
VPDVAPGPLLAPYTTLRVGGPARELLEPDTEADLVDAVTRLDRAGTPMLILGGGSNVVVADQGFDGSVVRVATSGVAVDRAGADVVLTAAAGESWDDLVARTVGDGLAGVEALSGIPGLTGATPIQNVGAYGQEVAQTLTRLRVLDRTTGDVRVLPAAQCGFGYRSSLLRGSSRYVVLTVSLRLQRSALSMPVGYAELARALGVQPGGRAALADVRTAVVALRRGKGMVLDPGDPDTVSVGSFFTNPVLSAQAAAELPPDAPRYPAAAGQVKTSAAWLIEQAGFGPGYGTGAARISTKHTLALTNRGGASTADVLALAREVRAGVAGRFGVDLTPEPVLVGCSL